ncbi:MAG TPA: glutamyl-tRNA reductase [Vicinamibacteria bacterium]
MTSPLRACATATASDEDDLVVVGLSHRTATLDARESLAIPTGGLGPLLERLREETGVTEAMVLSTCNRVEVYATGGSAAQGPIASFLKRSSRAPVELEAHLYRLAGEEAVRHAFRVASGLDSLVVGEPQILGQVKAAYEAARAAGTLGPELSALRHRTFSVAKRARTETGIGRHAISVSHVAVELARKIFGTLERRQVVLVGSGSMCALAGRRLAGAGAQIVVLGRTLERAADLAASLGARSAAFGALREELAQADIVVAGTASPLTVISREDVEAARSARGGRPLFLIDIAVPRDVEPAVKDLANVFLYDLDDLRTVADANLRERKRQAELAEDLVGREAGEFSRWRRAREAAPLLTEMRRRAEQIRRSETDAARQRMGPLTPEQEAALEATTTAIVNKLLHAPTVHLRELAQEGDGADVRRLRAALGLS